MINEILEINLSPSFNYIYGAADLTGLVSKNYGEFKYGISIGRKLDDNIIDGIKNSPTIEYYNHYNQINSELFNIAKRIKIELKKINIDSIIIKPTVHTNTIEFKKYSKTLTVEISHKMVATRAGLGWIGKTALLITKDFGPRLRLVSLLINQKPDIDPSAIEFSNCGSCKICVERCPAQAANGILWNIHIHRDKFFDAHKCRDKCGELSRHNLNIDKRICGICVAVCPIGKSRNKESTAANKW